MSDRLFLSDCGLVSPFGAGIAAALDAIFASPRDLLSADATLVPGRSVLVGAVQAALEGLPAGVRRWDCRNNRAMWTALKQIAPAIEAATRRFGRDRIAVVLGTSTSGIADGEAALSSRLQEGKWPQDFNYRRQEPGNMAEFVSEALGLSGPAYCILTACSSSAKAFASARRLIRTGFADAAIVGGADTLCKMTVKGFASLELLSPTRANPFSAARNGITIGEAAGVFLLSPDAGPVEMLGIGESSDAHHVTAPDPEGAGGRLAMEQALEDAGRGPEDVRYVALHGTGTILNDAAEAHAVAALFGLKTPCGSVKGLIGHTLGAAGAVGAALLWIVLNPETSPRRIIPHVWDGRRDPALPEIDFATRDMELEARGPIAMMSNAFGFGGTNVSLLLGRA